LRTLVHHDVAGVVVVDERSAVSHGLLNIKHGGERLVIRFHQPGRLRSLLARLGQHQRDPVSHVTDSVRAQNRLVRHYHAEADVAWHVGGGKDSRDAVAGEGGGGVDGADQSVGMLRPHHLAPQHVGGRHVSAEDGPAGDLVETVHALRGGSHVSGTLDSLSRQASPLPS